MATIACFDPLDRRAQAELARAPRTDTPRSMGPTRASHGLRATLTASAVVSPEPASPPLACSSPGAATGNRATSPDKKFTLYALNHNLYLTETGKEDVQLSHDSADEYTFNAAGGSGGGNQAQREQKEEDKAKSKDQKLRPQAE
jgi:hypothetical protein